jgi:hypothetical protein
MTNFSTRGIRDLPIPASLSQLTSVKNWIMVQASVVSR